SLDKTAAEQPLPTPPSSAPPNITASVDGSLDDSLDDSLDEPSVDRAVGTVEQPRPRPTRRTPAPRAVLEPPARGHDLEDAPTRQRLSPGLDSIDGSVFEMPAVRPLAVDDEPDPEPEALSDADIRLPQDTGRPRAANASGLLARLQAQAALEPEQRDQSLPPTPAPTDDPVEPTAEASTDDADDDLGDDEAAAPAGETTQVRPMPLGLFADRPGERTAVGPPPDGPGASAREATYRAVFEQFVATKRECGEADAVDFERFRAKLIRTRKTLMARFDCADVRFRVYVKAGKAALRAAPILDE
ncbi:MAG: hypothetical protein KC613_27065, partial [Myxococcales bacterium]|nr:hypothetical protein [Myxococcales bacterium]